MASKPCSGTCSAARYRDGLSMQYTPYWISGVASAACALCTLAFLTLDPDPDALLAISTGLNAGILIWASYQCYRLRILLSPVAQILIGPGLICYYSIGNLGARVAGDFRFAGNPGSLEYYPLASALCTAGMLIFCAISLFFMRGSLEKPRLGYESLEWGCWQG